MVASFPDSAMLVEALPVSIMLIVFPNQRNQSTQRSVAL